MELLVVGSCTGEKDIRDCPCSLTEADFDDPALLLRREAELSRWALPAVRLYTGWQDRYTTDFVFSLLISPLVMVGISCAARKVYCHRRTRHLRLPSFFLSRKSQVLAIVQHHPPESTPCQGHCVGGLCQRKL
jgi:hypothetical protein